ncbi:MAG: dephospho-CoA kinase [Alphaproteobacteria bacterium CG_4_9_14_3_um_filter_47_13]|nr:MAG: dephospho-CoA kinase [Alphaproteobacteria bacterium CG_4_9_14_3_um_filter_47_13]
MIIIGLTGSMAMGKSTAATMLSSIAGVAVHDSDEAVRHLYQQRTVKDLIKNSFPKTCHHKTDRIDKAALLETLGTDPEQWEILESILHPFVREAQQKFIREQQALGTQIVVLDIPLLFETGGDNRVDYTLCVTAPPFIQQQRIEERIAAGTLSAADAAFRMSRQMPDAEKRKRADFIVQTGQGLDHTRRTLEKIVRDLKKRHFDKPCDIKSFHKPC